jgi:hypothetical protein
MTRPCQPKNARIACCQQHARLLDAKTPIAALVVDSGLVLVIAYRALCFLSLLKRIGLLQNAEWVPERGTST